MEISAKYSKLPGNLINDVMIVKKKINAINSKFLDNKKNTVDLNQDYVKELECFKQIYLAIKFPSDNPYFNVLADA